jgi:hypothetical protein
VSPRLKRKAPGKGSDWRESQNPSAVAQKGNPNIAGILLSSFCTALVTGILLSIFCTAPVYVIQHTNHGDLFVGFPFFFFFKFWLLNYLSD